MKKEYTIIVDTREKTPYWASGTISKKLDVGDYSIKCNEIDYSNKISIERKSVMDLFGSLGKGNKRFKKELERARNLEYFAIIIDGSFRNIRDKDFPESYRTKMRGYIIIKILFTLHVKYGINIFMCNDRNESKSVIKQLFEAYLRNKI